MTTYKCTTHVSMNGGGNSFWVPTLEAPEECTSSPLWERGQWMSTITHHGERKKAMAVVLFLLLNIYIYYIYTHTHIYIYLYTHTHIYLYTHIYINVLARGFNI